MWSEQCQVFGGTGASPWDGQLAADAIVSYVGAFFQVAPHG